MSRTHISHRQIRSESKIYKIEAGDVGINRGDLLVMLDRYKVSEDDQRRETAFDSTGTPSRSSR